MMIPLWRVLRNFVIIFLFPFICLNVSAVLSYPEKIIASENPSWGPGYVSLKSSKACEFTAEVSPPEMFSLVKETYDDMCNWFTAVFTDYPLNTPLHSVRFVTTWEGFDWVKNSDEDLAGLFTFHTAKNEIIALFPMKTLYWEHNEEWLRSLLAHEIFHYFKKSCCYEKLKKVNDMDATLFEASAYWAQDQFLRRNFNTGLISYMKNGKTASLKRIDNFETRAYFLYGLAMDLYLFNAPLWFGELPREKFKRLVEGHYRIKHY